MTTSKPSSGMAVILKSSTRVLIHTLIKRAQVSYGSGLWTRMTFSTLTALLLGFRIILICSLGRATTLTWSTTVVSRQWCSTTTRPLRTFGSSRLLQTKSSSVSTTGSFKTVFLRPLAGRQTLVSSTTGLAALSTTTRESCLLTTAPVTFGLLAT